MRTILAFLFFILLIVGLAFLLVNPLPGLLCWVGAGACLLGFQVLGKGKSQEDLPPDMKDGFIDKS